MSLLVPSDLAPLVGARCLVTGHTGFKGSWLSLWLHLMGAEVIGASLGPAPHGAAQALGIDAFVSAADVDVRDGDALARVVEQTAPDVVFHLAAQPLVRASWTDRRGTFETNVLGTVNLLEAALAAPSVRAVVIVTTDKVYENRGTGAAFVEGDRLGGHDPYSASKAAAEVVVEPYRSARHMGLREVPIVTVRAGNVIGGWDWSPDRLLPDIIRSLQDERPIVLRRPDATRPWQHVLDCLWGYLLTASRLLEGAPVSRSYNFAHGDGARTVLQITEAAVEAWGASPDAIVVEREDTDEEAMLLQLDPTLAGRELGWRPPWTVERSVVETVRAYQAPAADASAVAAGQIAAYLGDVSSG